MSEAAQQPRKKNGGARPGAGRKAKPVDLAQLEQLCMLHVTDDEIAAFFNVGRRTVARWKERADVIEAIEAGRNKGRTTVRRLQMQAAQKGNAALLIWLGKQLLGQKEMSRHELTGIDGGPIETRDGGAAAQLHALLDRMADSKGPKQ